MTSDPGGGPGGPGPDGEDRKPTPRPDPPAPEGIEAVRRALCAEAVEVTAASFVALLEPVGSALWTTGADPSELEGVRIPQWPARFAAARAFARGAAYRLDDVASVTSPSCPLAQRSGAACALYLPVVVGELTIGVLATGWRMTLPAPLAAEREGTLAEIAEIAAFSL